MRLSNWGLVGAPQDLRRERRTRVAGAELPAGEISTPAVALSSSSRLASPARTKPPSAVCRSELTTPPTEVQLSL
jgi:hypothetical protein